MSDTILPTQHIPHCDRRIGAMGTIKMLLIDARHPEAVSQLRAARLINCA